MRYLICKALFSRFRLIFYYMRGNKLSHGFPNMCTHLEISENFLNGRKGCKLTNHANLQAELSQCQTTILTRFHMIIYKTKLIYTNMNNIFHEMKVAFVKVIFQE